MNARRLGRGLIAAAVTLLLAGCAGLPTSGPVNAGLPIGEEGEIADPTPIAQGPLPGADPEDIARGFLEASVTPSGNWETAQEFLTDDFAADWKPDASVAIDESLSSRRFDADIEAGDDTATSAVVSVHLDQVASVDAAGAYTEQTGASTRVFRLVRPEGGEWRIAEAPDGIVLDAGSLEQVYRRYNLQYFDQSWTHLVPDVRWFPRRPSMATTITRALISGEPSEWLSPAVRTAFPDEISLAGDAVPVDSSQVAAVSLNRAALSASPVALSRMRTQLEASLAGLGVSEVAFSVDGAPLEADTVSLPQPVIDPGLLVLNDETFGIAVGDELTPLPALTAQIAKIEEPIVAIDVALDGSMAAVQMDDHSVWAVRDGASDELDGRADLIAPSVDPFGFTWTVPRSDPSAMQAHGRDVARHAIEEAWPDAASISQLRVSADGARVAAIVTAGNQRQLEVAAIVREEDGVPVRLGEKRPVTLLRQAAQGLAWVGADTLAVLSNASDPLLTTHVIGGPSTFSTAPAGAKALSGGKNSAAVRVLSSDGVVYAQRGSSWQQSVSGVLVLGTRAGY